MQSATGGGGVRCQIAAARASVDKLAPTSAGERPLRCFGIERVSRTPLRLLTARLGGQSRRNRRGARLDRKGVRSFAAMHPPRRCFGSVLESQLPPKIVNLLFTVTKLAFCGVVAFLILIQKDIV